MKGDVKIKVEVSFKENGEKIANLLQNIVDNVNEIDLLNLYNKIEKDSAFFKKVIKVLDNPFVSKLFK